MANLARRAVALRLEGVVRDNRVVIAVVVPLVGATLLLAGAWSLLPASVAFNPLLLLAGVAVMRLPLLATLAPLVDARAGLALVGAGVYTYAVEFVGLQTGVPYGAFRYLIDLGPAVAGVPVGLPLFFLPLVFNAFLLATVAFPSATASRRVRIPLVVVLVLATDLVLDPAAVAVGFWTYADAGAFYGVPLSNFAGWLVSGTVVVSLLDVGFARAALVDRLRSCSFALDDLVSFTLFWGTINAVLGNLAPVLVALAFAGSLAAVGRLDLLGLE